LWTQRIAAGAEQHGLQLHEFTDGLHKNNIQINRKVLSELAAWEPATFTSLAEIAMDLKEKQNK
jgi:large subunit ribosomal protein L20